MSTIANIEGKDYTFTKGAPDFVLKTCNFYLDKDGQKQPITNEYKNILQENMESFCDLSLRTLLLAYKEGGNINDSQEEIVQGLTILGLAGIKDPLRDGIKEAVLKCNRAGVTVRMITGDNPSTAIAIAKEAGILSESWNKQ